MVALGPPARAGWSLAVRLEAVQRGAFEDVPWRLCKTFVGSIGSIRLLTMGRGGPCWAPAPALQLCQHLGGEACAKAAGWRGGSWISLAFRGFNKGLKGAELFCATETCCLLVSGSLLAVGGAWGCWVLPGKGSRCRSNAALQSPLLCHPAPLQGLAVTRLGPEPQPVVPIVRLLPLPSGVRCLKTSLQWQPGTYHPLTERRGFEAGI